MKSNVVDLLRNPKYSEACCQTMPLAVQMTHLDAPLLYVLNVTLEGALLQLYTIRYMTHWIHLI